MTVTFTPQLGDPPSVTMSWDAITCERGWWIFCDEVAQSYEVGLSLRLGSKNGPSIMSCQLRCLGAGTTTLSIPGDAMTSLAPHITGKHVCKPFTIGCPELADLVTWDIPVADRASIFSRPEGIYIIWSVQSLARDASPSECPVIRGEILIPSISGPADCNSAARNLQAPTLITGLDSILRLHFQWTPNSVPGATNVFLDISRFSDFRDYLDTGGGAVSGISLGPNVSQVDVSFDAAPIPLDLTSTFYARITTRVPDGTFCISNIVPFTLSSLCDLAAKDLSTTVLTFLDTVIDGQPISTDGGVIFRFIWTPSQVSNIVYLDVSEFPDFREYDTISGMPITGRSDIYLSESSFPFRLNLGQTYYARITTRIVSDLFCTSNTSQFSLACLDAYNAHDLLIPIVDLSPDGKSADITFDWTPADPATAYGEFYNLQIDKSPDFPRYQPFEPGIQMLTTQGQTVLNTELYGIFTLSGELDFDDYYARVVTTWVGFANYCVSNTVKFKVLRRLEAPALPPCPDNADYCWEALYRAVVCAGFSEEFPIGGGDSPAIIMTAIAAAENGSFDKDAISPTSDIGPFQVNMPTWMNKTFDLITGAENPVDRSNALTLTRSCLTDLECSASAAHIIYLRAGSRFSPWTAFTGGNYLSKLPSARQTQLFWSWAGGVDCGQNIAALIAAGGAIALIAFLSRRPPVGRRA